MVLTREKFSRNSLVLIPMAPLQNIITKRVDGALSLGKHTTQQAGDQEFFVVPPTKQASHRKGLDGDYGLVAFWWVSPLGPKDSATKVNMFPTMVSHNGVQIPALTNSKGTIAAGVKLVREGKTPAASKTAIEKR